MLTFKRIKRKLLNLGLSDFICEDLSDKDLEQLPDFEEVHSVGNREGGGDHAEIIWHFTDPNNPEDKGIYIRITGFYQSYNGTEWDEDSLCQVFPKKRKVTVWEPKKVKEKASV